MESANIKTNERDIQNLLCNFKASAVYIGASVQIYEQTSKEILTFRQSYMNLLLQQTGTLKVLKS